MEVFMIGNGFDLHYSLPTRYTSFLCTVVYLCKKIEYEKKDGKRFSSVAQVFSDKELRNSDPAIDQCVKTYGEDYDASINWDYVVEEFENALKNNWIDYLRSSFGEEKKWIDFEREIREVIQEISLAIDKQYIQGRNVFFCVPQNDRRMRRICEKFQVLFSGECFDAPFKDTDAIYYTIDDNCLTEEPIGSGMRHADKGKIASVLFKSLRELVDLLAKYFWLFVEYPVKNMIDFKKAIPLDEKLTQRDWKNTEIISFNYTHTMKLLYHRELDSPPPVYFLHGELNEHDLNTPSNLVLGVDADKSDSLGSLEVSFLQFKKYYQRVFFQTDISYLEFLNKHDPEKNEELFDLYIIGHSLDPTDKEVIQECFARAASIHVIYHDVGNLSNSIRNLVLIFGKKSFDDLRAKRKLQFQHIDCLKNASNNSTEPLFGAEVTVGC